MKSSYRLANRDRTRGKEIAFLLFLAFFLMPSDDFSGRYSRASSRRRLTILAEELLRSIV